MAEKPKGTRKKVDLKAKVTGVDQQPLSNIQWVDRDELYANDYNPNKVFGPELKLLRISILEDGWTQPIVIRESGEIVDGFHRWTVSDSKEVREMTDGHVPVVVLSDDVDREHQMMSTVRHNRARGSHTVVNMADIVRMMIDEAGMSREDVMGRLQMEWEEVDRLYDAGDMYKRGAPEDHEFSKGWIAADR